MNMKNYSKLTLLGLTATALLFAGCAQNKKDITMPDSNASKSSTQKPSTQPVTTGKSVESAAKPSSNSVYFAYDSAMLDEASKAALDGHAAWLNSNSENVTVEGNCDQRGSREYNLALGQRRADSVKSYLASQGVASNRIDTVSFGEERPNCTGSGEACWAQNRHADIVSR